MSFMKGSIEDPAVLDRILVDIEPYATDDHSVDADGIRQAFADWRADEIDTETLHTVLYAVREL